MYAACYGSLESEGDPPYPVAPDEEAVFISAAEAGTEKACDDTPLISFKPSSGFNDDRLKLVTVEGG